MHYKCTAIYKIVVSNEHFFFLFEQKLTHLHKSLSHSPETVILLKHKRRFSIQSVSLMYEKSDFGIKEMCYFDGTRG